MLLVIEILIWQTAWRSRDDLLSVTGYCCTHARSRIFAAVVKGRRWKTRVERNKTERSRVFRGRTIINRGTVNQEWCPIIPEESQEARKTTSREKFVDFRYNNTKNYITTQDE